MIAALLSVALGQKPDILDMPYRVLSASRGQVLSVNRKTGESKIFQVKAGRLRLVRTFRLAAPVLGIGQLRKGGFAALAGKVGKVSAVMINESQQTIPLPLAVSTELQNYVLDSAYGLDAARVSFRCKYGDSPTKSLNWVNGKFSVTREPLYSLAYPFDNAGRIRMELSDGLTTVLDTTRWSGPSLGGFKMFDTHQGWDVLAFSQEKSTLIVLFRPNLPAKLFRCASDCIDGYLAVVVEDRYVLLNNDKGIHKLRMKEEKAPRGAIVLLKRS